MSPSPDLESARERVVRLLTDRYADDTLTVEQFEAELDRLHGLGDVAAMERMAAELTSGVRPAVGRVAVAPAPPAPFPTTPAAAGVVPESLGWQYGALVPARVPADGRVFAVMSATKRRGPWLVPRHFRAFALMSEVVLDLRGAVIPAEGCEIELGAIMANVKVLLPPDVLGEVAMTAFMGNAEDHTHAAAVPDAAPRVRVSGSAVMAEVKVLQGAEAEFAALEMDD